VAAHPSRLVEATFFAQRWVGTRFPGLSRRLLRSPRTRELMLASSIAPGARDIPTADALRVHQDLVEATAFAETFHHAEVFVGGQTLETPIAVAFGTRDCVLGQSSRPVATSCPRIPVGSNRKAGATFRCGRTRPAARLILGDAPVA
jgi:hypothetical protein